MLTCSVLFRTSCGTERQLGPRSVQSRLGARLQARVSAHFHLVHHFIVRCLLVTHMHGEQTTLSSRRLCHIGWELLVYLARTLLSCGRPFHLERRLLALVQLARPVESPDRDYSSP